MRLIVEVEGEGAVPALPGEGAALVALMSFSLSRGLGAQHPLIALADLLHDRHRVRLGPLSTFYEADVQDSEDAEKLEKAWQPAGDLRETVEGVFRVMECDEEARLLARRADVEGLMEQAAFLLEPLRRAESAGKRVRLSYVL